MLLLCHLKGPGAKCTAVSCCVLLPIKHRAVPLRRLTLCACIESAVAYLEVEVLQLTFRQAAADCSEV